MKMHLMTLGLFAAVCLTEFGCGKVPMGSEVQRGPKWVIYTQKSGALPNNIVNCIAIDGDGGVWVGTDSGAARFYNGAWSTVEDSLLSYFIGCDVYVGCFTYANALVKSICAGQSDIMWYGMERGGLILHNPYGGTSVWQRFTAPVLPDSEIYAVACDQIYTGEIWAGTYFGLARMIPTGNTVGKFMPVIKTYTVDNSPLTTNSITALAWGVITNTIWIGMENNGVSSFNITNQQWSQVYPLVSGIAGTVSSIAIDSSNTVWVASTGGIGVLDANVGYWVTYYPGGYAGGKLPVSSINAVTTDLGVTRWFGSNGGLTEFNDATWTLFNHLNCPLPSDEVTSVCYDRKGNLWIGTYGGVAEFNPLGTVQ
jgi:ligand-binding sensor domain-containing protein